MLFTLCLPRDEASVPVARHLCRGALGGLGVAPDCISDVELAITEACTNVLKHTQGTSDEYEVTVEINGHHCEIRVKDRGGGFDHSGMGLAEAALLEEGGRGVLIMRALADSIDFSSEPEAGFAVRLTKKLHSRDGALLDRLVRGSYTSSS
ncbi:MAG: ATP-binding protein [Actinomycetota bacterium]